MLLLIVIAIILSLISFAQISSVFLGVPFFPTRRKDARQMIELAKIKPGDRVVDLGSGAGRLLFLAVQRGAQATGYELNPFLLWWTRFLIIIKGFSGQARVIGRSLFSADLRQADVVLVFLSPNFMRRLEPKLFAELKSGARIISCAFSLSHHQPIIKQPGIFVYQV